MWNQTQKITFYKGYVENFNFNQQGLGQTFSERVWVWQNGKMENELEVGCEVEKAMF